MNKQDLALATTLGLQFALTIFLFIMGGYWADKRLGTLPALTIILGILGFAAALYIMITTAVRATKKK